MSAQAFYRVAAGIFLNSGKVLMGRRHLNQGGRFVGYWEFPGGRIEEGESAEEALRREFIEELNSPIEQLRFYQQLLWRYPEKEIDLHFYFVRLPVLAPAKLALNAHSEIDWFELDQALDMPILPANRKVISSLKELGEQDPFRILDSQ